MDPEDHSETAANISDERTARLATAYVFVSLATRTATIGLVAVITLANLHFMSTRKAGSPGFDGFLETVKMEDTTDARQAEATCQFSHCHRYIPILNPNRKRKHMMLYTHCPN
jgi:hypothetical protein